MKIDKSNLMKTAWQIAKDAAVKFNDSVKRFFSESLKQAWQMIKNSILDQMKNHPAVENFSEWAKHGHHRVYFQLHGYVESKRGCKNTAIYYDANTGKLNLSEGRGNMTKTFRKNFDSLRWNFYDNEDVNYFAK